MPRAALSSTHRTSRGSRPPESGNAGRHCSSPPGTASLPVGSKLTAMIVAFAVAGILFPERRRDPDAAAGHSGGSVSLEGGTPLANARVRLTALFAPFEYDLDRHIPKEEKKEIGLFSGINYAESLHRPWLLPGLKTEATTDKDGRFELPGLPEGIIAELEVAHPQAVTTELPRPCDGSSPYRKSSRGPEETTPTLYGSGFKIELQKGVILRGQVTSDEFSSKPKAAGISVALANHNSPDGMTGKRFKTDSEGRFLVTGLAKNLEGYELAFAGSFAAPFRGARQRVVSGVVAQAPNWPMPCPTG